ncbi:MAG: amidohydrolase family protein [Pseudomonadota bacterium]|nr:amidohydrolase family protein [Pseudomonadota bacterium]
MAQQLFRATVVNPVSEDQWQVIEDAGLLVERGVIRAMGSIDDYAALEAPEVIPLDGVVVPGFVDVHIHWVQHHVRGRFRGELMPWLSDSIWPEEITFVDPVLARRRAQEFFDDLLTAGTLAGMAYSSPHPAALHIALAEAVGRWRIGNVIMARQAPAELIDSSQTDIAHIAALAAEIGPDHYVLTPRFALNLDAGLLAALGELACREGYYVQTHLAESPAEVTAVNKQFPEAVDYTDVYDRAGLLGRRSVLGHCIHLSERELRCIQARQSWIAHCPSSNEALGSGRMDLEAVRRLSIPWALGSDVGAGPSHSMLHVIQRFLTQHRSAGVQVRAEEALYRSTLAGARCLGWQSKIGQLNVGKEANFVLLPRNGGRWNAVGWLEDVIAGTPDALETRPLGVWLQGERVR